MLSIKLQVRFYCISIRKRSHSKGIAEANKLVVLRQDLEKDFEIWDQLPKRVIGQQPQDESIE